MYEAIVYCIMFMIGAVCCGMLTTYYFRPRDGVTKKQAAFVAIGCWLVYFFVLFAVLLNPGPE